MDLVNLNIQKLREIFFLIQYGNELKNKLIPVAFLINTLYIKEILKFILTLNKKVI